MQGLVLHTGAATVTREALESVPTPAPTQTWYPIPHCTFLAQVEAGLQAVGLRVVEQAHGLWRDGDRYFGLLAIRPEDGLADRQDHDLIVGLRNSHDRTFPAQLCLGNRVFVCDNLAFSGEVQVARRHTRHIAADLPHLIARAVGSLLTFRQSQESLFALYRNTYLIDSEVHDLLIRSIDAGVLPVSRIPDVLSEWRAPRHQEFRGVPSYWRLFNAFTEALKGNLPQLPRRTLALHGLLESSIAAREAREAALAQSV